MMKLELLLSKYTNEAIIDEISKYDKETDRTSYDSAITEMRQIESVKSEDNIILYAHVVIDEEDGAEYLQCYGCKENEKIVYSIVCIPWKECLGLSVNEEYMAKHGELTVLAAIIWEMTYTGYSVEAVENHIEILSELVDDDMESGDFIKENFDKIDLTGLIVD